MTAHRVRMRFTKDGDLRWISHRDLVRTFERMFRRAGIKLAMTQGYHPRPKLTFPSALALGVAAKDEIMEFGVAEEVDEEELRARIQSTAPPGLDVLSLAILGPQERKAKVHRVELMLPVPPERATAVETKSNEILEADAYCVVREDGSSVDIRPRLESIEVLNHEIRLKLLVDSSGGAKPHDILKALQLDDLLAGGRHLTRTKVEINT